MKDFENEYFGENLAKKGAGIIFLRRLAELLAVAIIPSAIIALLNLAGLLQQQLAVFVVLTVGALVFMAVHLVLQRKYYVALGGDFNKYAPTIAAYIAFIIITVLVNIFAYSAFVWLFTITKFGRYFMLPLKEWAAITVFHGIGLVIACIAHIPLKGFVEMMDAEITEMKEEMEEREESQDKL